MHFSRRSNINRIKVFPLNRNPLLILGVTISMCERIILEGEIKTVSTKTKYIQL